MVQLQYQFYGLCLHKLHRFLLFLASLNPDKGFLPLGGIQYRPLTGFTIWESSFQTGTKRPARPCSGCSAMPDAAQQPFETLL